MLKYVIFIVDGANYNILKLLQKFLKKMNSLKSKKYLSR